MYVLLYTYYVYSSLNSCHVSSVFFHKRMVDGLASAMLVYPFFFFFCRKVNCLQLCAAGCADNKHDHSLSSVCCLFQKAPLVLLLHSLSDNEGDWSILPLLPQWVSLNGSENPTILPFPKDHLFRFSRPLIAVMRARVASRPPAKRDWLLRATLEVSLMCL